MGVAATTSAALVCMEPRSVADIPAWQPGQVQDIEASFRGPDAVDGKTGPIQAG